MDLDSELQKALRHRRMSRVQVVCLTLQMAERRVPLHETK